MKVLAHNFHSRTTARRSSAASPSPAPTARSRSASRTTCKGRVFGKSGYVNGVSALSGYLKAKDGNWYAFSILMNNFPAGTNNRAKELQEKIVAAIDENAK